jgi:hypothetical protein
MQRTQRWPSAILIAAELGTRNSKRATRNFPSPTRNFFLFFIMNPTLRVILFLLLLAFDALMYSVITAHLRAQDDIKVYLGVALAMIVLIGNIYLINKLFNRK